MILDVPVLALTPGEPAGIGPECAVKLANEHPELRLLMVADPDLLVATAKFLGMPFQWQPWQPGDALTAGTVAVSTSKLSVPHKPGKLDSANSGYVLETIRNAVKLVQSGHAGALVTGPVHKGIINDGGHAFSGHTEMLADLAGVAKVVMMLAAGELRVSLVTTHLPLREVPDAVTPENVLETIIITDRELRQKFGIQTPRIQVLGLNPHAGEGGHLGSEDEAVIAPAIETAKSRGVSVIGPVPADAAFTARALNKCDAVIAMYHDQGLPVLKHAGFGSSVNITLGLPFIRTSVDHGTATDIAGQGIADASSLYHACAMARSMCQDTNR